MADETEVSEKKPAKKKPAPKKPVKKPAAKKPAAKKPAAKKPPKKSGGNGNSEQLRFAVEPEIVEVPTVVVVDDDDDDDDDDEVTAATPAAEEDTDEHPAVALSPEEVELQALYGDDTAQPGIVHAEYKDRQTADEDRPMMPEINARDERKAQWQERRDRRRSRREDRERQRDERREQRRSQPQQGQAQQGQAQQAPSQPPRQPSQNNQNQQSYRPVQPPVLITPATDGDTPSRVGTPLGDAAATVFAQLRNGQPLPVRQLAAMMRKRSLVETDPEQLAPQLKAELLGDERSYRTLGLRPRIVYRGRDLFAPGPVAMSQTADAEAGVATALSRLAGATHKALAQRIAKASPAGFERLIHAYLVAAGYHDVAWLKRVGGISYASATAPGIDLTVLISARSGDQPIDRRGIGELRVGVEAKNLVAGILFSARELSEDAERELERPGRSVSVMCGDHLVAALISTGVGVVSSAAPLHYVDDQLLDELLAG
jgi:Restriction endonuclease